MKASDMKSGIGDHDDEARNKLPYRRAAVLLALCALALLVWWFSSGPVLLHTHVLATADDQACGASGFVLEAGTGTTVLNPFRSRAPERTADVFLRAASNGECAPGVGERLCRYVRERRFPGLEWRLVNRWEWDSVRHIRLFYRLSGKSQELEKHNGCVIGNVDLALTGETWKISAYGATAGPYNGK